MRENSVCICILILYSGQPTRLHSNSARVGMLLLLDRTKHTPAFRLYFRFFLILEGSFPTDLLGKLPYILQVLLKSHLFNTTYPDHTMKNSNQPDVPISLSLVHIPFYL